MTQLFKVISGGLDITDKVSGASISESMNRFYDVATFTTPLLLADEEVVSIHFGGRVFNGFVFASSKTAERTYSVECRTFGAKLTEPYSAYTEGFDEATTSHELAALYSQKSGIPITIGSGELNFGGSYERKGTMLSALQNIANVTGAEYWDDGTGIQIQPNKSIDNMGVVIEDREIIDTVQSKSTVYNKGIGFITIRNGGSGTDDIVSKNGIYAEIDECTGEIFVFPNPYGDIEFTKEISPLVPVETERLETVSVLDKDVMVLDAAIKNIDYVTLNGAIITDYGFEAGHNVLYFSTVKRGTLTVSYTASGFRGYTNVKSTLLGRFVTFDMFYLDQMLLFQGFLSNTCTNTTTDGDMTCIISGDLVYNKGFSVYTIGGDPSFTFYNKATEIARSVDSYSQRYVSVESATLEKTASGYRYSTRYHLDQALGARANGVDIPYTTSWDGTTFYFEFDRYYPKVSVSYETNATKHDIQFATIQNALVVMVITNANTGQVCEYSISDEIPCQLNQDVPVSVATELGMEVTEVYNRAFTYTNPDGSTGDTSPDAFGMVAIPVYMDGQYVLDTSSIKPRSSITLTSNVNG